MLINGLFGSVWMTACLTLCNAIIRSSFKGITTSIVDGFLLDIQTELSVQCALLCADMDQCVAYQHDETTCDCKLASMDSMYDFTTGTSFMKRVSTIFISAIFYRKYLQT